MEVDIQLKKLVIILILLLLLPRASCLAGPTVLVLDEIDRRYFKPAFGGFQRACAYKIKRLDTSDLDTETTVERIYEMRPDVIHVMGIQCLAEVLEISDIPVVYALVLNPGEAVGNRANFSGVGLRIPMERKFAILRAAMPWAESVGMIYSDTTKADVADARETAPKFGFKIVAKRLYEIDNLFNLLKTLKNKSDFILMTPDVDVYSEEVIDDFFEYTTENMIPVVTCNDLFLEKGAFLSIHTKLRDLGRQAGEMANRILEGEGAAETRIEAPTNIFFDINHDAVKRLGLEISEDLVDMEF